MRGLKILYDFFLSIALLGHIIEEKKYYFTHP